VHPLRPNRREHDLADHEVDRVRTYRVVEVRTGAVITALTRWMVRGFGRAVVTSLTMERSALTAGRIARLRTTHGWMPRNGRQHVWAHVVPAAPTDTAADAG
jgi:hypothetical protein